MVSASKMYSSAELSPALSEVLRHCGWHGEGEDRQRVRADSVLDQPRCAFTHGARRTPPWPHAALDADPSTDCCSWVKQFGVKKRCCRFCLFDGNFMKYCLTFCPRCFLKSRYLASGGVLQAVA